LRVTLKPVGKQISQGRRIDADHVDPSARPRIASRPVANRKRRRCAEPGPSPARTREAAIHVAAEFFEPRRGIHDIAIEDDGAFDVADLADNHRPRNAGSANSGIAPNSRSNCSTPGNASRIATKQRSGRNPVRRRVQARSRSPRRQHSSALRPDNPTARVQQAKVAIKTTVDYRRVLNYLATR